MKNKRVLKIPKEVRLANKARLHSANRRKLWASPETAMVASARNFPDSTFNIVVWANIASIKSQQTMSIAQHPGAEVHESAGGSVPPQALTTKEKEKCKLGNVAIEFDQIQGNIFGGFNKDHQVFILFQIDDSKKAKPTLGPVDDKKAGFETGIYNHVAHSTSEQVLAFNEEFRAIRRAGLPEGSIKATWTNLVFTASGLTMLGQAVGDFPESFTQGMASRASLIGDVGESAPANWNQGMDVEVEWEKVHGMILVASDDPAALDRTNAGSRLSHYMTRLEESGAGVTVLGVIRGETRSDAGPDQVGHEHFGFKDGVSQPGIRGVDAPSDPLHNSEQGDPGQDLLHPGEFVFSYPTQKKEAPEGHEPPNPCQGPVFGDGKSWLKNGSLLVFRRLAQDVQGFREAVKSNAAKLGITPDLMGAKLIGRYPSGAPLEALKHQAGIGEYEPPMTDPGIADPALANSDALNNRFEYGEDEDGEIVPWASHIRKAYPRDQEPEFELRDDKNQPVAVGKLKEGEAESRTQTHRLLRRGIPFGKSLGAADGGSPNAPRGLLFLAYQTDIGRQFEFVQRFWVNNPDFPKLSAGQDPIITNSTPAGPIAGCPFHPRADSSKCKAMTFMHFVKTRGGGYFFSPSIKTLGDLLK
jgi:Dyp-type peroxidase family